MQNKNTSFFGPWASCFYDDISDWQKYKLCREPFNEHWYQAWFQLVQWFQGRRLKYKSLQTNTDDNAAAHKVI
jgi:hypothetical protein